MNAFGEQNTRNLYLAALVNHGAGCNMVSKLTIDPDNKSTFYIECPDEDWKLYESEFAAEDSALINIKKYTECIGALFSLINQARKNGGCWTKFTRAANHSRKLGG